MDGPGAGHVPERLIAACGLYCASCPTYAHGACAGCRALPEANRCHCACCVQRRGLLYCGQCADFPCDALLSGDKATSLSPRWLEWKRTQKSDDNT
ncbi:MAG: DUF3795 domain-containing protein [Clostridiales bacterium]|nr:DUF3795 domain-containing protein [Clostridiales bacterium]